MQRSRWLRRDKAWSFDPAKLGEKDACGPRVCVSGVARAGMGVCVCVCVWVGVCVCVFVG